MRHVAYPGAPPSRQAAIVGAAGDPQAVREMEGHRHASGPPGLRLIKGLNDEALSGEWKGHRSSRLGLQWRVLYRTVPEEQLFQVISITAHDYRRP